MSQSEVETLDGVTVAFGVSADRLRWVAQMPPEAIHSVAEALPPKPPGCRGGCVTSTSHCKPPAYYSQPAQKQ